MATEDDYDSMQDEYIVGDENIRDKTERELRWFSLQGCETCPGPKIGPTPSRKYTPEQVAQQEINAKFDWGQIIFWTIVLLAFILFFCLLLTRSNLARFIPEWVYYDGAWPDNPWELDPM